MNLFEQEWRVFATGFWSAELLGQKTYPLDRCDRIKTSTRRKSLGIRWRPGRQVPDTLANALEVQPVAAKQARREGGFLAQDPEQHVLVADVRVIESIRFLFGAVENVLRLVGKRNLDGGRQFLARALVRLYCRARL